MLTETENSEIGFIKQFYSKLEVTNPFIAKSYTSLRNKFVLIEYLRIVREISSYLKPKATLLDWGFGIGHMMYFLTRRELNVLGYEVKNEKYNKDNSEWQVLLKETNLLNKIVYGHHDVKLPFDDNSLDAVMSIGVLEHVNDPVASTAEIFRVLKPGGYLFIYELPNQYSLGEFIRKKLKKSHHTLKFVKSDLKKTLESQNYEVLTTRYASFLPRRLKGLKAVPEFLDNNAEALDKLDHFLVTYTPLAFISQSIEMIARKN